jgi:hypothetical protein
MTTTNSNSTTLAPSAFEQVLSVVPEADITWVSLEAMRLWNCTGGRPSDAARSTVAAYQSGRLTYEKFLADRGR